MTDSAPSRSRFRWFLYIAVIVVTGVAVWYFGFGSQPGRRQWVQPAWAGKEWPPNTPVRTAHAKVEDLPRHLQAIGTVTPLATVTVRSRVEGLVLRVTFTEGQNVERGQLLAEIDPAPYKIRLAQAEGQLRQNAARLEAARSDLARIRGLHEKSLVTDQELQAQEALVAQYEGVQSTTQAQVDDARLQLAWTRIEAPISGRTGIRRIDAGNLVRPNDTSGLVVITQSRPMSVSFTVPEAELSAVLEPFRAGKVLAVEAWDRGETRVLATGTLKTLDNQIDTATGTLRLKAEFKNEDERLFPNQFVNVRLRLGSLSQAIVIPASAVQFGSRGTYVYVVDAEQKAHVREIVIGPADGAQQSVAKGLKPGEQVVVEGVDRLREGSQVVVVNDTKPATPKATASAP